MKIQILPLDKFAIAMFIALIVCISLSRFLIKIRIRFRLDIGSMKEKYTKKKWRYFKNTYSITHLITKMKHNSYKQNKLTANLTF